MGIVGECGARLEIWGVGGRIIRYRRGSFGNLRRSSLGLLPNRFPYVTVVAL
jgi:hypothetical protein